MPGKRQAQSDLNHDNWDQEEEKEERGHFPVADESELNNRVMRKASRKSENATGNDNKNKSIFSNFTGFGKTSTSPFSFLAKLPNSADDGDGKIKSNISFGTQNDKVNQKSTSNKLEEIHSESYCCKLVKLNRDVLDWVKLHVDKNPLCVLSQIFKDYDNYLNQFKKEEEEELAKQNKIGDVTKLTSKNDVEKPSTSSSLSNFKFSSSSTTTINTTTQSTTNSPSFSFSGSPAFSMKKSPTTITAPTSIFGNSAKMSTSINSSANNSVESENPKTNGFNFGTKLESQQNNTTKSGFSFTGNLTFGQPTTSVSKPGMFSLNPSASTVSSTAKTNEGNSDGEDENEQPPKNEFIQVIENDAIYSKRCKVYIKKAEGYADLGVGTLYLKSIKDGEKTQLLVRADTSIGKILVNLILNSAVPVKRLGNKDIMLICKPTPEEEKSGPLLLRVKSAADADDLFDNIEKYTK